MFMYDVQVSDSNGSIISGPAVVIVAQTGSAPTITTQPVNAVINVGQSATFSVSASGSAPLSYTWLDVTNATIPVPNGSNATLTIVPAIPMARIYRVQVTNPFGSVMSRAVTLSVLPAPPVVQPDGSTTPPAGPRPDPLVIVSPALAIPSPANVEQQISFTVSTVDTSGATVTYSWDFGDGSTGSGSALFHSYATAGIYVATVTASSPYGSITSSVPVTIQPPLSMTITQLIQSSRGGEVITVSGVIPNVAAGFNPSGLAAVISVGTDSHAFMLSSRGTAKDSSGAFKLSFKRPRGKSTASGSISFTASLTSTAGNSAGAELPIVLNLGSDAYAATAMLTAHRGSKH
jgi:PKD repeat protein